MQGRACRENPPTRQLPPGSWQKAANKCVLYLGSFHVTRARYAAGKNDMELSLANDAGVKERLLKLVDDKLEVPMLPDSMSKLLELCNDPGCSPATLADCVRREAAVSAHVLRVANSALFGGTSTVGSIQQALARIGVGRLRDIVLMLSCKGRAFHAPGFESQVRESYRLSLAAAVISQEIARNRRKNVENAFISGLLHDIGTPVLIQLVVDNQSLFDFAIQREDVLAAIQETRASVGARMINEWHLPDRISNTIAGLDCVSAEQSPDEVLVLSLAISAAEDRTVVALCEYPVEVLRKLNLYPEDINEAVERSQGLISVLEAI